MDTARLGRHRGASKVSLAVLVFGVPFESWAAAVAVSFCFFFLRRVFSLLPGSLTVTVLVTPGGIAKVVRAPSKLSVPAHEPTVPAAQVSVSFTFPFFEARDFP